VLENNFKDREHPAHIVLIITGGNIEETFLKVFYENNNCSTIICVDGGLKAAYHAGIRPDYIIGDFDTIEPEILKDYRGKESVAIMEYNPVKDATDTEIALEHALSLQPDEIYLIGATGTRFDHTLGNVHILKKALEVDIPTYSIDPHNKIYMINQAHSIKKESLYGPYISLFPLTTEVTGVTLNGFKYPVEHKNLHVGSSLGISNEIIEDTAYISLEDGILIIIEAKD